MKSVLTVLIILLIGGVVVLEVRSRHRGQDRLVARHLAGLCNAVIGYYENNDSFPTNFEGLTRDPKGRQWGGAVFQTAPGGSSVQLVPVDRTSARIEVGEKLGSNNTVPEWEYTIQLATITPTNHNWHILVIHAPDKAAAVQEIKTRGIMEITEWTNPKRFIRCTVEPSR